MAALAGARLLALLGLASLSACLHASVAPRALGAGQATRAALPSELTVLSWNTHKLTSDRFAAELREFADGADVVLLQEAIYPDPAWAELDALWAWTLVVAFERAPGRTCWQAAGVATGSVTPPTAERPLLSPIPEPLTRTPKSALLSWIPIAGREAPALIVNLHGINFRRAAALDAQLRALDLVLAEHRGPVLVAGDFNTWSARRRAVVARFVARHGLVSAFADGRGPPPRLDHVFVRGLAVAGAAILPSRSSDHDALRIDLVVP